MPFPNPTETATLVVGGAEYSEWESVYVKHSNRDQPPFMYRFTCSEAAPFATNIARMRIRPGDPCTVILAGELAMTARVEMRQVFFDAHRHHIEIQGSSTASVLAHVAAVTDNMEYLGKTPQQILSDLSGRYGIMMRVEGGTLPNIKLNRFALNLGEVVTHAGERLLKDMNDKAPGQGGEPKLTSDKMGNWVINLGPIGNADAIVEGQNMISGREIIFNSTMQSKEVASGQRPVMDNKTYGAAASFVPFLNAATGLFGANKGASWALSELAIWNNKMLTGQASNSIGFLASDQITVTAVVHGWLKPSGGLWDINMTVPVISPMLILTGGESLRTERVEFTQDNQSGTRTTLTIMNEMAREQGPIQADTNVGAAP